MLQPFPTLLHAVWLFAILMKAGGKGEGGGGMIPLNAAPKPSFVYYVDTAAHVVCSKRTNGPAPPATGPPSPIVNMVIKKTIYVQKLLSNSLDTW